MEADFWIQTEDDVHIYVKKWFHSTEKPKAIIQIAHGMVEHINRYDDFAKYLVNKNIFVYGNDHRGHGKTGDKQGIRGFLSDEDGFKKTTNDLYEITKKIKIEYPNVPVILFGHSMGSFLVRKYIQNYSHAINGVILSGTGYYPTLTIKAGKILASILPPTDKSKLMNSLSFYSYNKKVPNNQTKFDWLTRDEAEVKLYIDDPHAGFIPTARFFYDLMDGLAQIHSKIENESIRKKLPMLFMSGAADPVGDYSKGVWKTAHQYDSGGIEEVIVMIFEDARHELLNELNKEEVYQVVYDWTKSFS